MSNIAIRVDNLVHDFGRVRAVDHLTIEIPTGIIFGFLGPNGAGKTTTIRLLLGLLEPDKGRAEVLGLDTQTHADEIRHRTGALLEHTGLYERLSVEDNLGFFARIWRLSRTERSTRIKELLVRLSLWERRREPVKTLSRGMKQKLAVARAMLHRPSLIFLDEPTAGLDPVAAAALRDDLKELAVHEKATVFLTTHNLAEAEQLCGLVGIIRQGQLLAVGSPRELRAKIGNPQMKVLGRGFSDELMASLRSRPEVIAADRLDDHLSVELHSAANTASLVSLLVHGGAEVEEVHRGQANLEEAFLKLMEEKQ